MESIIRNCIDKVKDNIEGVCPDGTPGTSDCLSCLQRQYFDDNPISYDCKYKICLYVARFFPVHVKENEIALTLLCPQFKEELLKYNLLNIMSIGGGPGSDLFAIKKFFLNCEMNGEIGSSKEIYLLRIDKEDSWNQIAAEVNVEIASTEKLHFDAKRKLFDITSKLQWPKRKKLFHIFTMSYFLSELTNEGQVKTVAEYINLFSNKNCSFLFINDRNDDKVNNFKRILFESLDCNSSYEAENSAQCHCGFFYNEEDRDLVKPKLKTNSIRFFKVLYI